MGVRFTGDTTTVAAGHLVGGQSRADMTQELVRYVLLASASATVAGMMLEGVRRRVAGTRFDRQLREQHP
jgi:acyl-[acyl carrier protein]--UDP-N-acetylglucosamine O-acyltransferase